jgi:hypothetical protein
MDLDRLDQETLLEVGFVVVAAGFVAGLGLLVAGRLAGNTERARRHAEAAPTPGSIPPERHQQLASSPR